MKAVIVIASVAKQSSAHRAECDVILTVTRSRRKYDKDTFIARWARLEKYFFINSKRTGLLRRFTPRSDKKRKSLFRRCHCERSEAIQTLHIYPMNPKVLDYFVTTFLVMTENEYI